MTHNIVQTLSPRQYQFLHRIAKKLYYGEAFVEEWERHVDQELSLSAGGQDPVVVTEVAAALFEQMVR